MTIIKIDEDKKTPKTDDDLSWLDGAITEHPPLTEEQRRKREADDLEHEHEAAMAAGRGEALLEIERRAEELKSAAFDGPPTLASWKAEGALLLWRAAYAAAYRELLMVEEWDRSLARGAGLPPSINEHPFERARDHAACVEHEAYMAELDAKYPRRLKGRLPQWWEKSLNVAREPKQDGEVE